MEAGLCKVKDVQQQVGEELSGTHTRTQQALTGPFLLFRQGCEGEREGVWALEE